MLSSLANLERDLVCMAGHVHKSPSLNIFLKFKLSFTIHFDGFGLECRFARNQILLRKCMFRNVKH